MTTLFFFLNVSFLLFFELVIGKALELQPADGISRASAVGS